MIVFLQEGIPVKTDHLISDASRAEEVSDSLCDQKDNLEVCQRRVDASSAKLTIVGKM